MINVSSEDIAGNAVFDTVGTEGIDLIFGSAGDDMIDGKGGDDIIFGGEGDDVIIGGDGLDDIKSGDGKNFVTSGKADIDGDGQANLDLINQNIEDHQNLLEDEDWV